ncbi:hypothetical protein, partial [Paracoccus sp. (in: a-proteobacteria)]|uniref:hypothetical protein n=1 Tax=Paracoccus sp. TaxID=267 RepID=UPI003340141A
GLAEMADPTRRQGHTPPAEHKRAFVAAIRADKLDLGGAAKAAGLTFAQAAEVAAAGVEAGKLKFIDHGVGDRWFEVVA